MGTTIKNHSEYWNVSKWLMKYNIFIFSMKTYDYDNFYNCI